MAVARQLRSRWDAAAALGCHLKATAMAYVVQ